MEWINSLLFGSGIAHTVFILAIVIASGFFLGKIKICGISLGITWILFVGIILSHFGMLIDGGVLHFVKEFGLILFVYSVGMQVGPGFFSAFKKGGITLNMLATLIVVLGVVTTIIIHFITGLPITTMVGVLSGAVTNTPGLGAAQQAYSDMPGGGNDPTIAMGYAVAYPLGVIGIILSIILFRYLFHVNMEKESVPQNDTLEKKATHVYVAVKNPALYGKQIGEIMSLCNKDFVVSRIWSSSSCEVEPAGPQTKLFEGDRLFVILAHKDIDGVVAFFGERVTDLHRTDWEKMDTQLVSRRILVTRQEVNGKRLGNLHIRRGYGVNVTRVSRAGIDLVANPELPLQIGDRVTVVGHENDIAGVERVLGNSLKRLREPNLITIFFGIMLGVLLGSLPITFPGIPQPVKLGLAGGPLIIAILVSRFGTKFGLVTYSTTSANLMLREIGISLFLAAVGLGAGEGFVETVANGGYLWIGYGFIITIVPLLIAGIVARYVYKVNYFTLSGLISGSMTDPPALAYSNAQASNDMPAVGYATVYPLTMFLRVLTAQLLILFCA